MVKQIAAQSAAEAKPTMMKAVHAAHMVDKNSRTIAKILQLLVRAASISDSFSQRNCVLFD